MEFLRTTGVISYQYSGGLNSFGTVTNSGWDCIHHFVPTLIRTTSDGGITKFSISNASNLNTNTITLPSGDQEVHSFVSSSTVNGGPIETQIKRYAGPATGTPLVTVVKCYNGNSVNCSTAVSTFPFSEFDVYATLGNMAGASA